MKNALGKNENLNLLNEQGKIVYEYYENSSGYWQETTYDNNRNELTYKNSNGYWSEYTRDDNGNELTYKDSYGKTRGFYTPEYTMEELVNKIGNFKLIK